MSFRKKNINIKSLFGEVQNKDFSKITPRFFKKVTSVTGLFVLLILFFICFEIYMPINPFSSDTITYTAQKGWGDDEIAKDLEKLDIIRSNFFFRFYVVASFQHSRLQAGKYILSPKMSIYDIAKKMAQGDVIKNKLTILEGWDTRDISEYLEKKGVCKKDEFSNLAKENYSNEFEFLKGLPKGVGLEGYLFPDTYEVSEVEDCQDVLKMMLSNFDLKITKEIKDKISQQKKSLFQIVTMASIIEKEVSIQKDKKIVSGILWKRFEAGMPLQVDCTINYITGKSDPGATLKDLKIDSPYNTYKYKGLPKGPISSPGINSIEAAISPTKTAYWYYLAGYDGATIFSKTLAEHNMARSMYLK